MSADQTAGCTSFQNDIFPKFTTEDIEHMNDFGLDLSDYEAVKSSAEEILERLTDSMNPMPPKPRGPWSPEWVACFKQWIDSGKLP